MLVSLRGNSDRHGCARVQIFYPYIPCSLYLEAMTCFSYLHTHMGRDDETGQFSKRSPASTRQLPESRVGHGPGRISPTLPLLLTTITRWATMSSLC